MSTSIEIAQNLKSEDGFDKIDVPVTLETNDKLHDKQVSNSIEKQQQPVPIENNKISPAENNKCSKLEDGLVKAKLETTSDVEKVKPESGDTEWQEVSKSSSAEARTENSSALKDVKQNDCRADNNNKSVPVAKRDPGSNGSKAVQKSTNAKPANATNTKFYDGINFVEAPIPTTNAWTKMPQTNANKPVKEQAPRSEAQKDAPATTTKNDVDAKPDVSKTDAPAKSEPVEAVKHSHPETRSESKPVPKKDTKAEPSPPAVPAEKPESATTATVVPGAKAKQAVEPSKVKRESASPAHAKTVKHDAKPKSENKSRTTSESKSAEKVHTDVRPKTEVSEKQPTPFEKSSAKTPKSDHSASPEHKPKQETGQQNARAASPAKHSLKPDKNPWNTDEAKQKAGGHPDEPRRWEKRAQPPHSHSSHNKGDLNDSANWPKLKPESTTQQPTSTSTATATLPSDTDQAVSSSKPDKPDSGNVAGTEVPGTTSNQPAASTTTDNHLPHSSDSGGDDSSTKGGQSQSQSGKKKNSKQKWKKIDIELPKQERRRRGGSRQRSSEVRDAPRGGRDRPATTRKYRPDQPEKTPVKDDVKVEATAAASSGSPTSQTSRRKEKGPEDQNVQEGDDRSTSGGANRGYRGSRRGQSRGRPFGRGGYRANATAAYQGHIFDSPYQYFYAAPTTMFYSSQSAIPFFGPQVYYPLETPEAAALRQQIEYYFSDENLEKDFFMRRQMDKEGWVELALLKNFRRVRDITQDDAFIIETMKQSITVETSENKKSLRSKVNPEKWTIKGVSPDTFSALKVDVAEFIPGQHYKPSVPSSGVSHETSKATQESDKQAGEEGKPASVQENSIDGSSAVVESSTSAVEVDQDKPSSSSQASVDDTNSSEATASVSDEGSESQDPKKRTGDSDEPSQSTTDDGPTKSSESNMQEIASCRPIHASRSTKDSSLASSSTPDADNKPSQTETSNEERASLEADKVARDVPIAEPSSVSQEVVNESSVIDPILSKTEPVAAE